MHTSEGLLLEYNNEDIVPFCVRREYAPKRNTDTEQKRRIT